MTASASQEHASQQEAECPDDKVALNQLIYLAGMKKGADEAPRTSSRWHASAMPSERQYTFTRPGNYNAVAIF